MSEPRKTRYSPIRAAIVGGFEDLRSFIQKELDEISTIFDQKANRIDDPENLTVDSSNVLPVTSADILALLGDVELPPQYMLHVTFDFEPAGSGLYYFSDANGDYQYLNQYPNNGAFALPVATQQSDVPILPYPGEMVFITGGWLGAAADDGVYIWYEGGASPAWMKLDWSVPSTTPLVWTEVTGLSRNFSITPTSGGANQATAPPAFHIDVSGGDPWVGTVSGTWSNGFQFAVVNNSTNRDCTVDFPGAQADDIVLRSSVGHWVYNGSTFDRQ